MLFTLEIPFPLPASDEMADQVKKKMEDTNSHISISDFEKQPHRNRRLATLVSDRELSYTEVFLLGMEMSMHLSDAIINEHIK